MKKLKFIAAIGCIYVTGNINAQICCTNNSSTQTFAMLSKDKSFVSSHLSPLPFNYIPKKGKMISYKTSDGKTATAFEVKASEPTLNYVFIFHEWWGLNDYIKKTAEELQKELGNVNVLALDLYDGQVAGNADAASKIMQQVDTKRCASIIMGAREYVSLKANIQTIGWCFGGGWSMQAAEMMEGNTKGCIVYYGMPETKKEEIAKINFPILGIFADKDQWITPAIASQFDKDLTEAGKTSSKFYHYDADHAFANPSNPHYDKEHADEAHLHAIDFLKTNFK